MSEQSEQFDGREEHDARASMSFFLQKKHETLLYAAAADFDKKPYQIIECGIASLVKMNTLYAAKREPVVDGLGIDRPTDIGEYLIQSIDPTVFSDTEADLQLWQSRFDDYKHAFIRDKSEGIPNLNRHGAALYFITDRMLRYELSSVWDHPKTKVHLAKTHTKTVEIVAGERKFYDASEFDFDMNALALGLLWAECREQGLDFFAVHDGQRVPLFADEYI